MVWQLVDLSALASSLNSLRLLHFYQVLEVTPVVVL